MSQFIPIFILVGCGCLIGVQAATDVVLGKSLGLWLFALMFTVVQLLFCIPPVIIHSVRWHNVRWSAIWEVPWWQYIGGALGVPVLAGMAFALARTGTFAGLVSLLLGQLAMGILVDQFGLFQAPVHPITLPRILGFVFVVIGVWFSSR